MNGLRRIAVVLAATLPAAGPALALGTELKVVVTSKPIHALVAAVMKDVGTPTLLVEGTASPHTFSMRPSATQAINRADVLFRVSEALEPFTAKVVRALPRSVRLVTLAEAQGVELLPRRSGGLFEAHTHGSTKAAHGHGHAPGHGHSQRSATSSETAWDAHVWLDPANAKAMVATIASALSDRSPGHAARFAANAEAVSRRLDHLSASLASDLAPVASKPFVVLHDAYQYFERRFGLGAVGSILIDPDEQPSAKRITDLRRKVEKLAGVCVFAEPNHQPRIVSSVTEGTTSRTAVLDPEGTQLDPGPELYFKLMEQMAAAMRSCLTSPV